MTAQERALLMQEQLIAFALQVERVYRYLHPDKHACGPKRPNLEALDEQHQVLEEDPEERF